MKRILSAHPLEGTLGENDETLYDVVYEQAGFVSSQHMEDIDVNGLKDVSEKPILQEQRPILQELYWRSWQSENDGMVFMEDNDMEEYVARDDNPYTTVEEAVRDAKQGQEKLGINTLAFGEDDAAITVYSDFCSTFRHEDSAFKDLSRDDGKNAEQVSSFQDDMKKILSTQFLEYIRDENYMPLYDVVYKQDGFISNQLMSNIDINRLKDISEKPILQEQRPILQELYWRSWQSKDDAMVVMEAKDMAEYIARDDNPYTTVEEAMEDVRQGKTELGIDTLAFDKDVIIAYCDFCSEFRCEESAFKDLSRDDEKNNGWLLSLSAVLSTDPYGTSVTVLGDEEEAKKFFSDEVSEHLAEDEKDDVEDYVEEGYFDSGDTQYRIIEANLSNSVREAIVNQSKDHGMKKGEANIGERAKAMQELIDAGIADYRKVKSYLKKKGMDTGLIHQRGPERA